MTKRETWFYRDDLAHCVVYSGPDRKGVVAAVARGALDAPRSWPVVREGREHERRHRQTRDWPAARR